MGPVETQITFTTSLPITRNTLQVFKFRAHNYVRTLNVTNNPALAYTVLYRFGMAN